MHRDHYALLANRMRELFNRTRELYSYGENKSQYLPSCNDTRKRHLQLESRELNHRQRHVPAEKLSAQAI